MANNDFHDGIDVCVGNWGYYSEGELRDTWMHLPMDPDEIEPWLRGHGLVDEEHSYGDIAVRNGYVELCETCYVNKRGDWPLLDEYPFEEIADETLAEWRGARGHDAAEKPAAPSEIAYAASAIAALSADDGTGGTERAAKL